MNLIFLKKNIKLQFNNNELLLEKIIYLIYNLIIYLDN
jgi:hypothetical protein